MNPERTKVSIGVSTFAEGDDIHLELAADAPFDERGTTALVEWLWERAKRRIPIVIDAYSPARDPLEARLKAKKMKVFILSGQEYTQACAGLHEAVEKHPAVTHFGQEHLDHSAKNTTQDPIKNRPGSFKWNRTSLDVDLAPTVAVTCAHFGATKFARRIPKSSEKKVRGAIVF
jgi:hypothetical protein